MFVPVHIFASQKKDVDTRPAVLGDTLGTVPSDPMAIEMASKSAAFFSVVNYLSCISIVNNIILVIIK